MQRFVQQHAERQRLIDSLKADLRKTTQEYFNVEVLLSQQMDKVSFLEQKVQWQNKMLETMRSVKQDPSHSVDPKGLNCLFGYPECSGPSAKNNPDIITGSEIHNAVAQVQRTIRTLSPALNP